MTTYLLNKLAFGRSAVAVLLGMGSIAYGDVPSMDVTVFDASSKVAFRSSIKANGTFATGNLQPGNYVVQFNAKRPAVSDKDYLLVVSAGHKKVIADAVPGEKFTGGGVAMRVDVGPGLKITGQVAKGEAAGLDRIARHTVIKGQRYVWVEAETGSNLGGHWIEESLAPARNIIYLNADEIRKIQDRRDEGSLISYSHRHFERPGGD